VYIKKTIRFKKQAAALQAAALQVTVVTLAVREKATAMLSLA
jgi:hypothetical protein